MYRYSGALLLGCIYLFGVIPIVVSMANANSLVVNVGAIMVLFGGAAIGIKLGMILLTPTRRDHK